MYLSSVDVNECNTTNGGCHQVCNNNIGSFECECNTGYYLGSNNKTCYGKTLFNYNVFVFCANLSIASIQLSVHSTQH